MGQSLSRAEILAGLLHRIENFDPANFETDFNQRLILQKTIYLMQNFDLYIGYDFSWYIKGPYSPDLTKNAFGIIQKYDELPLVVFTNKQDEDKFSTFLSFIKPHLYDEYWLECIASIHFLFWRGLTKDRDYIFEQVLAKMPNLERQDFDECWQTLIRYNLIREGKND